MGLQRGLCLVSFRDFPGAEAGEERASGQCQLLNTLRETEVVKCPSQAVLSNHFCICISKPTHTHVQINLLDCLPTCSFTLQVSTRCSDIRKKSSKHTYTKIKCTVCTTCIPFKTIISLSELSQNPMQ